MKPVLKIPEEFSKYLSINEDANLCFDGNKADPKSIWSSLPYGIAGALTAGYFLDFFVVSLILAAILFVIALLLTIVRPENLLIFNKKGNLLQLAYKKSGKIVRTNSWNEIKMHTETLHIYHGQISVTHGRVPILNIDNSETGEHLYDFALKSRSHKELDALMHFFDDFMSGRPIKEHYYTPPGNAA